jgi:hypothetical protein
MAIFPYLNSKPTIGFGLIHQNEKRDITPPAPALPGMLWRAIRSHPKKRLRDQMGPTPRTGPQKRQTYNKLLGGILYVAAADYLKANILRRHG